MSESLSQFLFGLFIVSVFTLAVSLFFYYQSLRRKAFIDMAATMKLHFQYLNVLTAKCILVGSITLEGAKVKDAIEMKRFMREFQML